MNQSQARGAEPKGGGAEKVLGSDPREDESWKVVRDVPGHCWANPPAWDRLQHAPYDCKRTKA